MRIDKWLWAARFYKTRSLAQLAVESGKVRLNGDRVKPAKELKAGDALLVHIGASAWDIRVAQLSDKRGSAVVARALYDESPESVTHRAEQMALRKLATDPSAQRHGRPTKRERRQLERWRDT